MFRLTAKIEIKGAKTWEFDKVISVEITRDMETLTDTCTLQLPRKVKWQGAERNPLKRGDKVSVWLGYDDNLQLAFRGYITTIGYKAPITIECEDEMFIFKSREVKKKAYSAATIEQILKDQDLGVKFRVVGEQSIGSYRVTSNTITELFGHLKDNGGVRFFFKTEGDELVLYAGVLFDKSDGYKQVFCKSDEGGNIINDSDLDIQSKEDVRIKLKAISLQSNNKKIRVEVGDTDGETRTAHTYNKTESELKAWALQELERLKRDGLTGSFTTFGFELVDKLDNVAIKIDGERKGVYQVEKNVIKYGSSGYRQEITIGARVAE